MQIMTLLNILEFIYNFQQLTQTEIHFSRVIWEDIKKLDRLSDVILLFQLISLPQLQIDLNVD